MCALVTGVQTCALPISTAEADLDAVPAGDEEVGTSDEAPRKRRIGIGGKLIAAFSAVAALTLVACAVAWFSFDTAENADWMSVVDGHSVYVRVNLGGRRIIHKK